MNSCTDRGAHDRNASSRMLRNALILLASLGLVGAWYFTNHFTAWGRPAPNNPGGWIPFAICVLLGWAILRAGVRLTVFALVPLLVLLGLVELGLRFYYAGFAGPEQKALLAPSTLRDRDAEIVYSPHHYALYIPDPLVSRPDGLRHNHLGLRDERSLAPDPDAIRIVFLGGSSTYTTRIHDNEKIFSRGLEGLLNEHFAARLDGRRVEVVNAGMGGATSAENLIRLAFFVSEIEPDLLIVQHGVNDVWPRMVGTVQSDYGNYRRRWGAPSAFREHSMAHAATLWVLRLTMLGSYVVNRSGMGELHHLYTYTNREDQGPVRSENAEHNDARYFERNTRYMIALAREMGARVLLATAPTSERAGAFHTLVSEHNALTLAIATEEDTAFFDYAAVMATADQHMPDGIHVSQVGSDLKRDLYFDHLIESGLVGALIQQR
jgi:lysophospholipase L1-like esterase